MVAARVRRVFKNFKESLAVLMVASQEAASDVPRDRAQCSSRYAKKPDKRSEIE